MVVRRSDPSAAPASALESPPAGWPEVFKESAELKSFLGKRGLQGRRCRVTQAAGPEVLNSAIHVQLGANSFENAQKLSDAFGWAVVRGFAIFGESTDEAGPWCAHPRAWNEKPSGAWVDLTARAPGVGELVLLESSQCTDEDALSQAVETLAVPPAQPVAATLDAKTTAALDVKQPLSKPKPPDPPGSAIAAGSGEVQLVAVLASHISNEKRLRYLSECLQSVRQQTQLPSQFLVGISALRPMLKPVLDLLRQVAAELAPRGCAVHTEQSKTPRSQFEHHLALLPRLQGLDARSTWVMFSDDDDLWHPRRAESYAAAVRAAPESLRSLYSPVYGVNTQELELRRDGSVVTEQLTMRRSSLQDGTDNYWSMVTRLEAWRAYFEATPALELKSIYSDVDYSHFAFPGRAGTAEARTRPEHVVAPLGQENWMCAEAPRALPPSLVCPRPLRPESRVVSSYGRYLYRQDHAGNPQHSEQQKTKLTPLIKEALESYFSKPKHKKRFCADLVGMMGMPAMAAMMEPLTTVETMASGYIDNLATAEGAIELFRVMLRRDDGPSLAELKASKFGEAQMEKEKDKVDDTVHAALFPHAAREQAYAEKQQAGVLGDLFNTVSSNSDVVNTAYKSARLEAMSSRGYVYEPVTVKAVLSAFKTAYEACTAEPTAAPAAQPAAPNGNAKRSAVYDQPFSPI